MEKKIIKDFLYEQDSYKLRGACFSVWNTFKSIFKEKILENALNKELEEQGLKVERQKRINIYYKDEKVGVYTPDLVINDRILIEIKVKPILTKEDEKQFWHYLQGSKYRLGFLVNFGTKKLEIRRRIYDKARQKYISASNQRTYQRFQSASISRGFSLIELLVVIGVIMIFTGIVLIDYQSGQQQLALQRSASKLAQDIRRVQEMAMSAREYEGEVPAGGYGIYFWPNPNPSPPNDRQYILFGDVDENHIYNSGLDYEIEVISVEKGVIVQGPIQTSEGDRPKVNITFTSPDPEINIVPPSGNPPSWAKITLILESDLSKTKTITINEVGMVEID